MGLAQMTNQLLIKSHDKDGSHVTFKQPRPGWRLDAEFAALAEKSSQSINFTSLHFIHSSITLSLCLHKQLYSASGFYIFHNAFLRLSWADCPPCSQESGHPRIPQTIQLRSSVAEGDSGCLHPQCFQDTYYQRTNIISFSMSTIY